MRQAQGTPAAAGELAGKLDDLPLALAQAAAYVDARAVTISGYLALYRNPVLAHQLRDEGLDAGDYPASVAQTWLLAIRQLSADRPAAVELLRLCAFLDPDDIDLDVLAADAAEAGGSWPRRWAIAWSGWRIKGSLADFSRAIEQRSSKAGVAGSGDGDDCGSKDLTLMPRGRSDILPNPGRNA